MVVEATRNSGSLITARLAVEQNREVFAVPGSIQSFKSTGTHTLIKQGAKLVEHAQDIVDELAPMIRLVELPPRLDPGGGIGVKQALAEDEIRVYDAIGPYPIHIDDLIREIDMGPGKISGILLKLELAGLIRQSPGKYFTVVPED